MTAPVAAFRDPELVDLLRDEPELIAIADAIAATAPRRARRKLTVVALFAATVCAAGIAVAPAFGVHFGAVDFWAAPAAPPSAPKVFATKDFEAPGLTPRGLRTDETRRIAVERFRGETMRLFVAPFNGGGFCYQWALKPDDTGVWIGEFGGCGMSGQSYTVAFDDTRVSIVANSRLIDRIALTLSNGRVVYPAVHWVSAPVNAGFVLYQPPAHLHFIALQVMRGDTVVAAEPLNSEMFSGSG